MTTTDRNLLLPVVGLVLLVAFAVPAGATGEAAADTVQARRPSFPTTPT